MLNDPGLVHFRMDKMRDRKIRPTISIESMTDRFPNPITVCNLLMTEIHDGFQFPVYDLRASRFGFLYLWQRGLLLAF